MPMIHNDRESKVFCDHCDQYVSRKTRYNHKQDAERCEKKYSVRKRRLDELDYLSTIHDTKDAATMNMVKVTRILEETETKGLHQATDKLISDVSHFQGLADDEENPHNSLGGKGLDPMLEKQESLDINQRLGNYADSMGDEPLSSDTEDLADISFRNIDDSNSERQEDDMEEESVDVRASKIVSWITASLFSIQLAHNVSDSALIKFFVLLKQIFLVLSPFSAVISTISKIFPKTLYMARKILNMERMGFIRYVVCPNCCYLYNYDKVVNNAQFKNCSNKVFSCRSASPGRKKGKVKCNTVLVNEAFNSDGTKSISPKKVYCYQSLIDNLQRFLHRPEFLKQCNAWRQRSIPPNLLADVYDGEIWKKFYQYNGSDFLTHPHHFGVMLNVDWFQPYQRRSDISVGALYMVLMNFPREERFKKENCILIGVIPSLKKEPESLNTFLSPLVSELKALWKGVLMQIPGNVNPVPVKVALMCAAADIPAARKLSGFLGHGAIQGCSLCTKPLWFDGERDCGIPDLGKWPSRCRSQHLKCVSQLNSAECLTQVKKIEKEFGYRQTSLLDLPYFEPSQMTAIDPMHNLFLGTAKKMFTYWVDKEILPKSSLTLLSSKIEDVHVPSDIGRIPVNISSNFSQMTAKEWKNWVIIYSLSCLQGLLPSVHLKVWQTFVLACKHFCLPCIDKINIEIGRNLMAKFCTQVAQLYGKQFLTPNMHLHCHLNESVKSFGSMYSFWLFSFERYNGIMSDFHTNKRNVEEQLMRKFLMFSNTTEENVDPKFHSHLTHLTSLMESSIQLTSSDLFSVPTSAITSVNTECWSDLSQVTLKNTESSSDVAAEKEFQTNLCRVYSFMYRKVISLESVSSLYRKYPAVHFNNQSLGSAVNKRTDRNSHIFASWADDDTNLKEDVSLRLGVIRHFVKNVAEISPGVTVEHVFAYVDWFKKSPDHFDYLHPVSVWSTKLQNDGPASLLPLQRIHSKAAWRQEMHNSQKFIVAVSAPKIYFM